MKSASPAGQGLRVNIGHNCNKEIVMSSQSIADAGIGALCTVFFCIGAFTDGRVSSFALIWAGMMTGYLITTYLNEVQE